jgi:hypothetical protein
MSFVTINPQLVMKGRCMTTEQFIEHIVLSEKSLLLQWLRILHRELQLREQQQQRHKPATTIDPQ